MPNRSRVAATLLLNLALAVTAAVPALADGALFGPWGSELYETEQIAVVEHDAAAGTETLHVLPGFRTESSDFAWIVPVPALPEVGVSDFDIFQDAVGLTAPVWRTREETWGCASSDIYYGLDDANGGVDIIDDRLVGIYRTLVLGADDASALADSLTAWGFLHDDNREATLAVLEAYIERSWYFVAMMVDPEAVEEWQQQGGYWYGNLSPIRLEFATDEPIYPLAISMLSAAPSSDVVLYTITDKRLTFPDATTFYANRVTANELQEIRRVYPNFGALLHAGDFVTKLCRTFAPDEMTEDLVLTPAGDDEFHQVFYSGIPWTVVLLLGTGAWLKLRPRRA